MLNELARERHVKVKGNEENFKGRYNQELPVRNLEIDKPVPKSFANFPKEIGVCPCRMSLALPLHRKMYCQTDF